MKRYTPTSVSEFLGDFIVYRNLRPVDARLPGLTALSKRAGLQLDSTPRKSTLQYAQVITQLIRLARALDAPKAQIERLVYVGDTRLNDGTAFANICRAGNWSGLAFIGADRQEPARIEIVEQGPGTLYLANRWQALPDFDRFCRERDFAMDEHTAVIVDLDKTALGGRGRNDQVIDQARVAAAYQTVRTLLGENFDAHSFETAYHRLNQPEFHPFTADNQDYLVYICLILGCGLLDLKELLAEIQAGRMATFRQFIERVHQQAGELPANLRTIHDEVYNLVNQGDPTPFKAFRYNEFQVTVGKMGYLDADTPVSELLTQEIVVTQEVRAAALAWREQGAVLFGLSDKPDEASIPSEALAIQGLRAIHQVKTDAVGA